MAEQKLKRNIRMFEAMIFVIGFVIGSGIFLKPSIVLRCMGSSGSAILIWIIGGIITLCASLTICEIAAYIPKLGGLYTYLCELYGGAVGYLYGWVEGIIASPGGSAAMAIAIATFSTYFVPMSPVQQKLFAILIVLVIVAAQIISTKFSVYLQTAATIGKMIPIAAIIIWGLMHGTAHSINFVPVGTSVAGAGSGIGIALLGVLWSYDGWINTCTLGDEIENSPKNLPRAIIGGLLFVICVYIAFNIAVFNTIPADQVMTSEKIGVDVSVKLFGEGGTAFITAGMIISIFGALNAQMICGTRIALAMGQKKVLLGSAALGAIHPKLKTPINSLILETVLCVIYILSGSFDSLTNLTIFAIWIFFTIGIFGIFRLREKFPRDANLYHVPLYPLTPILGIAGGVYLMFSTVKDSFWGAMLGIGLTLVGLPIYYYCKRKSNLPSNA